MTELELHAATWKTPGDFYAALLSKLGAPNWHGHNLDALEDSIFTGDINKVDPPFLITITGTSIVQDDLKATLSKLAQMFEENRKASGRQAYLELRP